MKSQSNYAYLFKKQDINVTEDQIYERLKEQMVFSQEAQLNLNKKESGSLNNINSRKDIQSQTDHYDASPNLSKYKKQHSPQ